MDFASKIKVSPRSIRPVKKARPHRKLIIALAVAAAVCAVVCIVGGKQMFDRAQAAKNAAAMASVLDTDRFYNGISVQGVSVGGMTMQQAQKAVQAKQASSVGTYSIKITHNGEAWELTQKDMTFTYNTDTVLKEAYAYGRTGSRETRFLQVEALKATPKAYQITATPDEKKLQGKVNAIAEKVTRAPQNPTITSMSSSGNFRYKDGVNGLSVDTKALWSGVKAILDGKHTGTVEMQTASVPFSKTIADVNSHMKKLGSFSTVSTNNSNGTYNMEKALLAVNGTCIPAGGTFSFFGTVGPCDQASGYLPAGAIYAGKHIEEYGGGICQSSTTIYGAALRSGMQIVERYNHSVPSSYCELGQDATVSYPGVDLKMKNATDYPMYIQTYTSGNTLTAVMYGYRPASYDSIDIVSQADQTFSAPSSPTYMENSSLGRNQIELEQHARTGYRASARRVFKLNGNTVRTEYLNSSYYPATAAVYSYGPGTDSSKTGGSSSRSPASKAPSSQKPASKKPASQAPASKPSSQKSGSSAGTSRH